MRNVRSGDDGHSLIIPFPTFHVLEFERIILSESGISSEEGLLKHQPNPERTG